MHRCPLTYDPLPEGQLYSLEGLRRLSPRLHQLRLFPYTMEQQRQEALRRASKMSIQGVQPKLSARLNVAGETFEVVDTKGQYIMKPETFYPEVPANEDLTMRLAALVGIEVPLHGLIYTIDHKLTYFIKRFDRHRHDQKLALEDFAQLSCKTRDTKYAGSLEDVIKVVDRYCTFPQVERVKLFERILFSFLVGNEDMHLKNYSLIRRQGKIELSPAYDLLNSSIAMQNYLEESALPLGGKKNKLTRDLFITYLAQDRLQINDRVIEKKLATFAEARQSWVSLIQQSFLSHAMQDAYLDLLAERLHRLGLG